MVLSSLFKAREKLHRAGSKFGADVEKPFLEHLDDLRKMLMRMAVTLVIGMIVCFLFNKPLMDVLRYPVKLAGLAVGDPFQLPSSIDATTWRKAQEIAKVAAVADPQHREIYLAAATAGSDGLRDLVDAYAIFRTAATLDHEARAAFVEACAAGRNGVLAFAELLLDANPNPDPGGDTSLIRMSTFSPAEPFTIAIKVSLYAGIVLTFPFLLYFLAEFVLPGLHTHEKRLLLPAMSVGFALFMAGVLFAYFVVTPRALEFFEEFGRERAFETDWRIGYYVKFVTQLVLLFGLCFELPVVVIALVKLELLNFKMMHGSRSYAVVAIYIVAALITPTVDLITLNLLAVPMIILYEMCIWIAYFMEKKAAKREAGERAARETRRAELASGAGAAAPGSGEAGRSGEPEPDETGDPDDPYHSRPGTGDEDVAVPDPVADAAGDDHPEATDAPGDPEQDDYHRPNGPPP